MLEQLNTFLSTYRLVVPGCIEPLYCTLQQELQRDVLPSIN